MYLACERSGQYRATKKLKHDGNNTSRITGTKKCGCPFDMRAHRFATYDEWTLTVVCGLHNHPPAEHLEGHSYAGRLSKDEKALLMDMSKSMVRPKEILVTLKQRDALNVSTLKTIYNVRHRNRVVQRAGRSQMQHLLGKLANMRGSITMWVLATLRDVMDGFVVPTVKYVIDTWLVPYKDKFVAAWTDTCMHCGNVTTNRAESAHAKLKRQLGSCQVSFQASFEKIHILLELQHTDIMASFEKSLTVVQHQFKLSQFRELWGNVSISALEYLLVESKRANSIGIDVEACGCVLRHTHGLPCTYEIADYIRQDCPIPLATIHSQWRQLHISICKKEKETEVTCHAEVELFVNKFNESDRTMRLELLKKLKEIVYPESTFLVEPEVKPKTRPRDHKKINVSTRRDPCAFELVQSGHDSFSPRDTQITTLASTLQTKKKRPVKGNEKVNPKGKVYITRAVKPGAYVDAFPSGLKPYIKFVDDVAADGNCGFRAIAASIGHIEDDWAQVRRDLLGELHTHKEEYITLYGSYERIVPVPQLDRREIAIGFVNGNHFVQVLLQPGHPVPPIATNWRKYRHPCAVDWDDAYVHRIQHFKDIIHDNVATRETFDVVDVA
ncbi:uncharacterized protein LOC114258867 [Camellia sinensis]|uniref:uncharacterized protein LOC114258867 n=1 Tax=Camellia sinensis TaxID=4442 RepID=UPI001036BEF4|nr:uncharacterized protein LOC114258867 [Camellia sinensis]